MNHPEAISLLSELIATPSLSRQEEGTAAIIYDRLKCRGASPMRFRNNVYALSDGFDRSRPTLLLNSHHDTVKPAATYTRDPFTPSIEGDRLYGLGSNDAGASAVALSEVFLELRKASLPFNLLLAITAEEEVGGENGMRAFLPHIQEQGITVSCAIVGEPTGMQGAIAERGLVVLDCETQGVTGHAARGEGINAIYRAMSDIGHLRDFRFPKESEILGPISVNITQINAGWQHNAIPDKCNWVVDIRTTDAFSKRPLDYCAKRSNTRHSHRARHAYGHRSSTKAIHLSRQRQNSDVRPSSHRQQVICRSCTTSRLSKSDRASLREAIPPMSSC